MVTGIDNGITGDLLAQASDGGERGLDLRQPLQQVKTGYTTAVAVQQPRDLAVVHKRLMAEAKMAGESFYYGWGAGKDRIEGPSICLAMAAARCYHNSAVDILPLQETEDAWIFTAVFVDLETGFTLTRQFRQSKKWTVHGKFDAERKDDIRFQIGQSKAARNAVLNALPKWLIDAAVVESKQGVREKIEKFVAEKGLPAAVGLVITGLAKHGVKEEFVLEKCAVPKREGLTIDHIVMLRGDLYALDNGQEYASSLFPAMGDDAPGSKVGKSAVNDKMKSQSTTPAEEGGASPEELARMDAEKSGNLFNKAPHA